jgi:4-hydroxybenzoate polyprenyltransferase
MITGDERAKLRELTSESEEEEIYAYINELDIDTIHGVWADIVEKAAIWLATNGYRITTYSLATVVNMVVRNMGMILEDYWDIADDLLEEMGREREIHIRRPATNED